MLLNPDGRAVHLVTLFRVVRGVVVVQPTG
jgi:hypothetical protein